MKKQETKDYRIAVTPASAIDFKSEEIKRSFEKVKEKKKELATLYKIDQQTLNIRISI